ncbi:MAG: zinc ribbon domain-containing protein [Phycisphaerae bacterium]|nr:zinc ribbon domain-containing protein [Phycisphaerae bacterium]
MPIYEYHCGGCGHVFEHFHRSSSDAAPARCPACDGRQVERKMSVISAPPQAGAAKGCPMPAAGACSGCCNAGGTCPL